MPPGRGYGVRAADGTRSGPLTVLSTQPAPPSKSVYGYADPAGPQNGIPVLANLMGFTVVDVSMRGTGCYYRPLTNRSANP